MQETAKSTARKGKTFDGFSAQERAAMKERAKQLKAEARGGVSPCAAGRSDPRPTSKTDSRVVVAFQAP